MENNVSALTFLTSNNKPVPVIVTVLPLNVNAGLPPKLPPSLNWICVLEPPGVPPPPPPPAAPEIMTVLELLDKVILP